MVKIILSRIGKRKQPSYRLIVLDKQKDPWGKNLEILGNYNPRSKELDLKIERIKYWLSKGARPSATVHNLLVSKKIIEAKKVHVTTISKRRLDKMNAKNKAAEDAKAKEEAAKAPKPEETPAPAETEAPAAEAPKA